MKIYLDPRLRDIPSFRNFERLFEGTKSSAETSAELVQVEPIELANQGYLKEQDIFEEPHHVDKVKDFLQLYFKTIGLEVSYIDSLVSYGAMRLYSAKGTIEIFDILEELCSINGYTFKVSGEFTGVILTKLRFGTIISEYFNEVYFALLEALFHLLLLHNVKAIVEELIIKATHEVEIVASMISKSFYKHEIDYTNGTPYPPTETNP